MRKYVAALLVIAACGGGAATTTTRESSTTTSQATTTILPPTTTSEATTTTLSQADLDAMEFEADADLVVGLWRGLSDSWLNSTDAGYEYLGAHNHPIEECTAAKYASYLSFPEGSESEFIVDQNTIERDDGWAILKGPGQGTVPEGRIYIFTVNVYSVFGDGTSNEQTIEGHSVVDPSGEVFFFIDCAD